jgi:hypothetical protein
VQIGFDVVGDFDIWMRVDDGLLRPVMIVPLRPVCTLPLAISAQAAATPPVVMLAGAWRGLLPPYWVVMVGQLALLAVLEFQVFENALWDDFDNGHDQPPDRPDIDDVAAVHHGVFNGAGNLIGFRSQAWR